MATSKIVSTLTLVLYNRQSDIYSMQLVPALTTTRETSLQSRESSELCEGGSASIRFRMIEASQANPTRGELNDSVIDGFTWFLECVSRKAQVSQSPLLL